MQSSLSSDIGGGQKVRKNRTIFLTRRMESFAEEGWREYAGPLKILSDEIALNLAAAAIQNGMGTLSFIRNFPCQNVPQNTVKVFTGGVSNVTTRSAKPHAFPNLSRVILGASRPILGAEAVAQHPLMHHIVTPRKVRDGSANRAPRYSLWASLKSPRAARDFFVPSLP